jgi:hypothetical protein
MGRTTNVAYLVAAIVTIIGMGCSEGSFGIAPCADGSVVEAGQSCPTQNTLPDGPGAVPTTQPPTNTDETTEDPMWTDGDGDGIVDRIDNCPGIFNPLQEDLDSDMHGDACDNCPRTANVNQDDDDANGIGDICQNEDHYDTSQDSDSDSWVDTADNCPQTPNVNQRDRDADGVGDACDNCPDVGNRRQTDSDSDGTGDACSDTLTGEVCASEEFRPDVSTIEPAIYILLDASGSMADQLDPGRAHPWPIEEATDAIDAVAVQFASTARLGLGQFPHQSTTGSTCTMKSWMDVGDHAAGQVQQAAAAINALGNTPTGYALNQVLDQDLFADPGDVLSSRRPKTVILITDGDPTVACDSGSPDNRRVAAQPEAVAAASRLRAAGIPVHVVGFRSGAREENLDAIATAGGTDAPGPHAFYATNDTQELVDAIGAITQKTVSCTYRLGSVPRDLHRVWVSIDGQNVPEDARNGFQFDPFGPVVQFYGDACATIQTAPDPSQTRIRVDMTCTEDDPACSPQAEVCDYEDNDCDGEIDEGCDECRSEICDGVDNDCDGDIDENCPECTLVGESCLQDAECCQGSCVDGVCGTQCYPMETGCVANTDCCSGSCSGSVDAPGICVSQ